MTWAQSFLGQVDSVRKEYSDWFQVWGHQAWWLPNSNTEIPRSYQILAFLWWTVWFRLTWSSIYLISECKGNTLGKCSGIIQALKSLSNVGRCQSSQQPWMEQDITSCPSKLWASRVRPDLICPLQAYCASLLSSLFVAQTQLCKTQESGNPGYIIVHHFNPHSYCIFRTSKGKCSLGGKCFNIYYWKTNLTY